MKLWLVLNTTQYFVLQSQASKKSKWNNRNQEEEDWQHNTERWIERTLAQHHRHTASAARPPSSHSSIGSTSFERSKTTHSWKFNRTAPRYWIPIFVSFVPSGLFFDTASETHVDIVWQVIGKAVYIVLSFVYGGAHGSLPRNTDQIGGYCSKTKAVLEPIFYTMLQFNLRDNP